MPEYTVADLHYDHYDFTDTSNSQERFDLDTTPLKLINAYEVSRFASTFFDFYVPNHTIYDLYSLEFILRYHLPADIRSRNAIAIWIAKHSSFLTTVKNLSLFTTV